MGKKIKEISASMYSAIINNWKLKLLSFVLAVVLWMMAKNWI